MWRAGTVSDLKTEREATSSTCSILLISETETKWHSTGLRLGRTASDPYRILPDAAEERALGSSLKDSSFPKENTLADLFLRKTMVLPQCNSGLQKSSHSVQGWKGCIWDSLKLPHSCTAGQPGVSRAVAASQKDLLLNSPGGVSSLLEHINLSNWSFVLSWWN